MLTPKKAKLSQRPQMTHAGLRPETHASRLSCLDQSARRKYGAGSGLSIDIFDNQVVSFGAPGQQLSVVSHSKRRRLIAGCPGLSRLLYSDGSPACQQIDDKQEDCRYQQQVDQCSCV
jgi:hypothetical protein